MTDNSNYALATRYIIQSATPESTPPKAIVNWGDTVVLEDTNKGKIFAADHGFWCGMVVVRGTTNDDSKAQWAISKNVGGDEQFVSYNDTFRLINKNYDSGICYVGKDNPPFCLGVEIDETAYNTRSSKCATNGDIVSFLLPRNPLAQPTVPVCTECTGVNCTKKRTGDVTATYVCGTNVDGEFTLPIARRVQGNQVICECQKPGVNCPKVPCPQGTQCVEGKCKLICANDADCKGQPGTKCVDGVCTTSIGGATDTIVFLVIGGIALFVGYLIYRSYEKSKSRKMAGEEAFLQSI
jgi:hypothetical protein